MRDAESTYCVAQAVTAAAVSTNKVNHKVARNLGVGGRPVYIVGIVDEEMDDTGDNSELAVTLETDALEAMGSPTVKRTLFEFPANSIVGTRKFAVLAPDELDEAFSQVRMTPVDGDLSAGKFTIYMTNDLDSFKAYPDARQLTPQH